MTFNHLNLTVTDPSETSAFLAKYFGLQPAGGNAGMQMLRDDGGMVLTLMKARHDDRSDVGLSEGLEGRVDLKGLSTGRSLSGSRACATPARSTSGSFNRRPREWTKSTRGSATTASPSMRRRTCMGRGRSISRLQADSRWRCWARAAGGGMAGALCATRRRRLLLQAQPW